jgi:hypothetical protein
MLRHGRSEQNFVPFTDMSLHGRSEQIFGPIYWYVAAWKIWANFWSHLLICRCMGDLSKILVPIIDMLLHGRSEQNFVQFTDMSLHGRSEQIFGPIYWYVAAWKIWRNPVMGHMWVTLCHEYIMIWLWPFFAKSNWSWHANQFNNTFIVSPSPFVSRMWPVMDFPQMSHATTYQ